MDGWMDLISELLADIGWMDGWMGGSMDGWFLISLKTILTLKNIFLKQF